MSTLRFRYEDFVKKAKLMPREYGEAVLANSSRKGPDLVMSSDAYRVIKDKFKATVTAPAAVVSRADVPGCKTCGKKTT